MMEAVRAFPDAVEAAQSSRFWGVLTCDDKAEFARLRADFLRCGGASGKDRRVGTFQKELGSVLAFLERDGVRREERSIVSGIAFAGPFICVNTRQLKLFLGRCKSSINGSFQQLGYVALRTRTKARLCIGAVLAPLAREQGMLRQWTVRFASAAARCCFVSSFPAAALPPVADSDLVEDRPRAALPVVAKGEPALARAQPVRAVVVADACVVEGLAPFDDTDWAICPCPTLAGGDDDDAWWECECPGAGGGDARDGGTEAFAMMELGSSL